MARLPGYGEGGFLEMTANKDRVLEMMIIMHAFGEMFRMCVKMANDDRFLIV